MRHSEFMEFMDLWTRTCLVIALLAAGCACAAEPEQPVAAGRSEQPAPPEPAPPEPAPPEPAPPEPVSPAEADKHTSWSGPADPPVEVELSHEQRIEVARLLASGRKAAAADDHSGALEIFERALAIAPSHAKVLCEAGWAGFHAEDPRAEALLHKGARLARDPLLQAACLYNLGRVYERADQGTQAALAYADSIALRPENTATRSRYRKVTGHEFERSRATCPPGGRFADVEAFCRAVEDRGSQRDREHSCSAMDSPSPFETTGPSAGEFVFVVHDNDDMPYWDIYMLLRRGDEFEVLGSLGTEVFRGCADGSVEIERARWLEGKPRRLVVELHKYGEYSCNDNTPWQSCIEAAEAKSKPSSTCDGVSDEWVPEIYDDRFRMLCAEIEGSFRCSAPPQYYSSPLDAAARRGPVPEGEALEAMLSCPPKLQSLRDPAP